MALAVMPSIRLAAPYTTNQQHFRDRHPYDLTTVAGLTVFSRCLTSILKFEMEK
jgi:hypothetical protein